MPRWESFEIRFWSQVDKSGEREIIRGDNGRIIGTRMI